jgi:hypothetical protein
MGEGGSGSISMVWMGNRGLRSLKPEKSLRSV